MYDNFLRIDEDKRNRIENAAFEIFAKNGYKRASTLEIAKKAEISKGALFHYFENKRNLYFYLYDIGVELIMEEMNIGDVKKNSDFFSRMEDTAKAKMKAMKEHPFVYAFFVKAYIEEDKSVENELKTRLYALASNQSFLLADIDMSKFRKQVDLELLSNLIVNFAVEFLQSTLMANQQMDMEKIIEQFKAYLDMLKDNFYKEEYL